MEALCPDCNNELTPSIVGYLCHNCGTVHQFDRVTKQRDASIPDQNATIETSTKLNQKSSQDKHNSKTYSSTKSSNRFKDFIIPRISNKNATSLNSKK